MATENSPDYVAAQWIARIDRSSLTPQEEQALKEWINIDIRHKGAFLRAQAVWQVTQKARALQTPRPLPLPTSPSSVVVYQPARVLSRRIFLRSAAAAASFGLFAIASKTSEASTQYTTLKNILHCRQSAGQQLILDCYSQVNEYSELTRMVYGRCLVAGAQRAVKTSQLRFVINGHLLLYKDANYESGIVMDGHASVQGQHLSQYKTLSTGEQITRNSAGRLHFSYLDAAALARLSAWTNGQISLDTQTISEASDIFNRYNQKQLVPSFRLADYRLSGLFDLSKPDIFALAVKSVLGGRIREDGQHIYLE
ncbi:DUF4880 domain-containing protein [Acetobacter indonesiensis]|uniref:DUF4880 domain-containing protein n=1 Tax=Acetobacter indonesiensis TaxID=104101 RepID=UPI0039EAAA09